MLSLIDMAEKYSKSFKEKEYSIDIQNLLKEAFIEGARFERNKCELAKLHYRYH